jgi:hypothetical protein
MTAIPAQAADQQEMKVDSSQVGEVTSVFVGAIKELTDTAGKGSTVFLYGVAAALAIMAFIFKLNLFGFARLGTLESVEFIAVLVLSLALFMFASWLRFLEYRAAVELMRHNIWKSEKRTEAIINQPDEIIVPRIQ